MKVTEIGERSFVERLCQRLTRRFGWDPRLKVGPGDDAAVVSVGDCLVVLTVDGQIEGVHFRRSWMPFYDLGWKAVAISISDLTSMGARPLCLLLSVALSGEETLEELDQLYDGAADACLRFSCLFVGGDTSKSGDGLWVVSTALGLVNGSFWTRSGGKDGDRLIVTGSLGEAAAGLLLLEKAVGTNNDPCVLRFRRPEPPADLLPLLRSFSLHAAIDISDGLVLDASRLAFSSGLEAVIDLPSVPLSKSLKEACRLLDHNPLPLALTGGEDYQLLMAVSASDADAVVTAITQFGGSATVIGSLRQGTPGAVIGRDQEGKPVRLSGGYQHF
ncbi:MAG: thiamine-phosphate kinase [Armatimonadetes bacterium]|nr:thiamine-phosphate kinase [Armatimonadota bacterium]MDW8121310.1 thiamine-phosphate kinase [Armatimonadota bacterium]